MENIRILQTFLKGLQILELTARNQGLRLADISREMHLPPSNTTLYLNTLLQADLIIRDPETRKFFVSPRAIALFGNAGSNLVHQLLPSAEEPMMTLHKLFNENVLLAVQKNNTFVFIKYITTNHLMRIGIDPEPEFSMHISAAGRAILAFLPEKEITRYVKKASFVKLTEKTVDSEESLRKVLHQTLKNGYAFNAGEFEEGVMAVAAPVIVHNRPIASLVVQFPAFRHSQAEAKKAAAVIMQQADKIAVELQNM